MVKKYYQPLIAMIFAIPMTSLAFLIFIEAFFMTSGKAEHTFYVLIVITALLLVIVMAFYYGSRIKLYKQLKNVDDLHAYEEGGMIDRTYVLEDRMLVGCGLHVEEVETDQLVGAVLEEKKHGKYVMHLKDTTHFIDMSLMDLEEGQRIAAYLKRVNPSVVLTNVEPKGTGTLRELGADVHFGKR